MRQRRPPISPEMREEVLKRDNHTCRYCGDKEGPFKMDHVYPFSKGGETTIENLATSCGRCNGRKSNKIGIWPNPNQPNRWIAPVRPQKPPPVPYPLFGMMIITAGFEISIMYPGWMKLFSLEKDFVLFSGLFIVGVGIYIAYKEMHHATKN